MPSRSRRSSTAIAVAVFLAGAALLGLEIAASRVLAPYFGNSLYVWGALIGVVLAGLSTGYWIGGVIADRYPTPRLLVAMLAAASLLVLAIPFVDDWVLDKLVAWDPGPRLNPLLATIFLFGAQSVILGTVSPIAVRLKAHSLDELGRTAGRLFAISTAGSIAGTFATAFWLIPELGTDQVLASAAVALMLAAAAVAFVERLLLAGAVALALSVAMPRRGRLAGAGPGRHRLRLAAPELVAGLPAAARRAAGRLSRGPAVRLHDPAHEGLAVPPDRGGRGRREPLPPLRQLVPERDVQGRPVPDALRVLRLPAAAARLPAEPPAGSSTSASAAARRRSGPGATSRRRGSTSSSSTPRSSTSPTSTSTSRATRGCASRSRTAAASSQRTTARGTRS